MRVAYVAGPYRSKAGIHGIKANINAAMDVARQLWLMGYAVVCPHGNTALMDGVDAPDSIWLDGDIEILGRCDLIVMIPGWEASSGAQGELQAALDIGLPAYYWPQGRRRLIKDVGRIKERRPDAMPTISTAEAAAVLGRWAAEKKRRVPGVDVGDLFSQQEAA